MPINYNKPKDRLIFPRGPRDLQRKQLREANTDPTQIELIESLQAQIKLLKEQPTSMSDEKINNEIIKVVKEETIKYKEQIDKLELENNKLKDSLNNKDILIEQLKRISSSAVEASPVSDRPEIEESFIDPIEKDLNNVESHIDTEETIGMSKEDMTGKVDKLKKLLGKI
jgi:translation initiation factor 2B subunit (eIF-2B alpha/beta/delta family)